jgi:hypothetical protein
MILEDNKTYLYHKLMIAIEANEIKGIVNVKKEDTKQNQEVSLQAQLEGLKYRKGCLIYMDNENYDVHTCYVSPCADLYISQYERYSRFIVNSKVRIINIQNKIKKFIDFFKFN